MDVEKLCIYCMKEKPEAEGVCPYCHGEAGEYQPLPHHLPPLSILQGRYLLGRSLGEGGFGITYIAYDLVQQQRCAIKELFIAGKLSRQNTKTVLIDSSYDGLRYYNECKAKFLQEAEVLYQLEDKSGVVAIWDFFEENDTAYIVMEYLEGQDLKSFLNSRGGRISHGNAFRLLRPVMKSMIQVHSAGIIHRDISPDNIRYLSDNHVKIMDFGSARMVSRDTYSELVLIKEGYAPPEQYASGYKVGPWMDVYAMCATLYRCITGNVPKPAGNRMGSDDLVRISEYGVEVPEELERVLYKGMELVPEKRYQDMWELYQALKPIYPDGKDEGADKGRRKAKPKPKEEFSRQSAALTAAEAQEDYQALLRSLAQESKEERSRMQIVAVIAALVLLLALVWLFSQGPGSVVLGSRLTEIIGHLGRG